MISNWDIKFINLAKHISTWSKDRSTKIGAVIVDKDNRIVSIGYNGFPTDINDNVEERHQRPAKYLYTEHAERNSIYNSSRIGVSTKGCSIYISQLFPCTDCARAIIQSGIDTIYCNEPNFNDERWGENFKVSYEMLIEANIKLIYHVL